MGSRVLRHLRNCVFLRVAAVDLLRSTQFCNRVAMLENAKYIQTPTHIEPRHVQAQIHNNIVH